MTLASYHLLVFTEWVDDYSVQYLMGWSFIIVIMFMQLINILFAVVEAWHNIKLLWLKWYPRLRLWCRLRRQKEEVETPGPPKKKFRMDSYQP